MLNSTRKRQKKILHVMLSTSAGAHSRSTRLLAMPVLPVHGQMSGHSCRYYRYQIIQIICLDMQIQICRHAPDRSACSAPRSCATGCTPSACRSAAAGPQTNIFLTLDKYFPRLLCGHLVVALEGFEGVHGVGVGGGPHPLHCLPGGHHPDVLHRHDRVQEQLEPLLVVRRGEPAGDNALVTRVRLCHESSLLQ